jgi:hypothetical protein
LSLAVHKARTTVDTFSLSSFLLMGPMIFILYKDMWWKYSARHPTVQRKDFPDLKERWWKRKRWTWLIMCCVKNWRLDLLDPGSVNRSLGHSWL